MGVDVTREPTAAAVQDALGAIADPSKIERVARSFRADPEADPPTQFLGVPPGEVFDVAKRFAALPLDEIEALLESPFYEARLAAVSVMDAQARQRRTSEDHRQALFDLYLRRHDRIDNWDLVDRAAPHVVGRHLLDKPRDPLFALARSTNPWERRTAIVATYAFIREGDVDDTFRIAVVLAHDDHDLVQKAVGSWVREAGKRDRDRLLAFLDDHASALPRVTLRYATEKLDPETRARYL